MAKILNEKRVIEYEKEYKVKVVELTEQLDVKAIEIAEILGLHPMMLYRWRQEYREGKLSYESTRRVGMTAKKQKTSITDKQLSELEELKELRKKNARLEKENDLLKKWQGYLAELKQKDSRS